MNFPFRPHSLGNLSHVMENFMYSFFFKGVTLRQRQQKKSEYRDIKGACHLSE